MCLCKLRCCQTLLTKLPSGCQTIQSAVGQAEGRGRKAINRGTQGRREAGRRENNRASQQWTGVTYPTFLRFVIVVVVMFLSKVLIALVLFVAVQRSEASCEGAINVCYQAYVQASKLVSDTSCAPYRAMKLCLSTVVTLSTCTDSQVAQNVNISAANVLHSSSCNGSATTQASFICFVIMAVLAFLRP